jgi:hypothetical protein
VLVVAFVTLTRFCVVFGIMASVGGEGAGDVNALLELAFFIASHIPLVGPGIDQFAFGDCRTPSWLLLL